MPLTMDLPICTSFQAVPRSSPCPYSSSNRVRYGPFFRYRLCKKLKWNSKKRFRRIAMSLEKDCVSNEERKVGFGGFGGESETVEVIGIGSRKDALLDFCLDSPFRLSSTSLRFWNILVKDDDSSKVHLQQRLLEKGLGPRIVEAPLSLTSCSKAIILVASAGYGLDHTAAIDILRTVRSANGFSAAIILKPFSFEGQRRQDEVKDLVGKLQEHASFCIDIDTNMLLEKDLVTLDEALKTANSAVLLAINAISVILSDLHKKIIDAPHNNVKVLKVSEVIKILESYKEAKVGFGAGYNIRASIAQAVYDCPFLGEGLNNLNGMVVCILVTSNPINESNIDAFLRTFRQTTEYKSEIIISVIHEPNLEPNLLITTVFIVGCIEQKVSQKSSILFRLAQHFPFVFNLLNRHSQQPNKEEDNSQKSGCTSQVLNLHDSDEIVNKTTVEDVAEGFDNHSKEVPAELSSNYKEMYSSRTSSGSKQNELHLLEARTEFSNFYDRISEGTPAFQRDQLTSWNLGPGYEIAREWARERAAESGATPMFLNVSIFSLPVGVRSSEELRDSVNISNATQQPEPYTEDDVDTQQPVNSSTSSWSAFTGAGFEAVKDFYNTASILLKRKNVDVSKRQGLLSVRAASMLEAERDSPKKWSPTVEMQYRGGVYWGRCQGGLPEGKGRLILGDGSIYDGMWRYGKRSGLGTFYFCNGDVFQGSWRDNVMHGKGWFYFHTGDRWFANFWKGKVNGEGRFYSMSGDVFFGHFQDGWRHGIFHCIDIDGTRFVEIWDEGVLVSRKQLDSDTESG